AAAQPTDRKLDGRVGRALDRLGLGPHICSVNFRRACPQGPLEAPSGAGAFGYAWYPMGMGGPPDIAAMLSSKKKLEEFLDECLKHYPIDPKKLVVLGFSQGGVMAYGLALTNPQRFAAVAVLSS